MGGGNHHIPRNIGITRFSAVFFGVVLFEIFATKLFNNRGVKDLAFKSECNSCGFRLPSSSAKKNE
jgi:hypothetical protein